MNDPLTKTKRESRTEAQEETEWNIDGKRSRKKIAMASSGAMTNGRDLDRNRRTGAPLLLMLKVDLALRSKTLVGHGTGSNPAHRVTDRQEGIGMDTGRQPSPASEGQLFDGLCVGCSSE